MTSYTTTFVFSGRRKITLDPNRIHGSTRRLSNFLINRPDGRLSFQIRGYNGHLRVATDQGSGKNGDEFLSVFQALSDEDQKALKGIFITKNGALWADWKKSLYRLQISYMKKSPLARQLRQIQIINAILIQMAEKEAKKADPTFTNTDTLPSNPIEAAPIKTAPIEAAPLTPEEESAVEALNLTSEKEEKLQMLVNLQPNDLALGEISQTIRELQSAIRDLSMELEDTKKSLSGAREYCKRMTAIEYRRKCKESIKKATVLTYKVHVERWHYNRWGLAAKVYDQVGFHIDTISHPDIFPTEKEAVAELPHWQISNTEYEKRVARIAKQNGDK